MFWTELALTKVHFKSQTKEKKNIAFGPETYISSTEYQLIEAKYISKIINIKELRAY